MLTFSVISLSMCNEYFRSEGWLLIWHSFLILVKRKKKWAAMVRRKELWNDNFYKKMLFAEIPVDLVPGSFTIFGILIPIDESRVKNISFTVRFTSGKCSRIKRKKMIGKKVKFHCSNYYTKHNHYSLNIFWARLVCVIMLSKGRFARAFFVYY